MITIQIYLDRKKEYRWRMTASNSQIIADSGEGYSRKSSCKKSLKRMLEKLSLGNYKIKEPS